MKCEVRGPGGGLGRGFPGGLSARRVNKEGAVDRCGWRMSDGQVGCEWVSVTSGTGLPGLSQT